METPTQDIQRVLFCQDTSDSENDQEEDEDLPMEDAAGEQASTCNDTDREQHGEQSIELSVTAAAVDVETQEKFLKELRDVLSVRHPELLFSMASGVTDSSSAQVIPTMLITPSIFHHHPPFGLVPRIQVSVQYKVYAILILMRVWKKERFDNCDELGVVCEMIGNDTKHKFYPGVKMNHYMSEYYEHIQFHIKSARVSKFPFSQVDSHKCHLYFELAHKAEKESRDVLCYPCKRLLNHLKCQKTRTVGETPTRKLKQQRPSSTARLSYMSPASQAKRKKPAQYERTNSIRKLSNYEDSEMNLDDAQNEEMCNIVQSIGEDELEKLYTEGEKHGVGTIIKEICITDVQQRRKQFLDD